MTITARFAGASDLALTATRAVSQEVTLTVHHFLGSK